MEPPERRQIQVGFLLIEGFSSLCLSSMTNVLRAANRLEGAEHYVWHFLTADDLPVTGSDGLVAPSTLPASTRQHFDFLFLCAGMVTRPRNKNNILAAMQRLARRSSVFGCLSTGAFLLARAGMLNGYQFTLHWENIPAFEEEFPNLRPSRNLYVIDRDRWSGSGGLSSLELGLRIIAQHHGPSLVHAISNQFQVDRVRPADADQRSHDMQPYENLPARLQSAIQMMQLHMETPVSVPDIALHVAATARTLERLFRKHLDESPAQYYRNMRLERARQLLWHSNISILEISFMTGFSSPSYLSRIYKMRFGKLPSAERQNPGEPAS